MTDFADLREINNDLRDILLPPRRIMVSDAAAKVVRINTPGGYAGPWDPLLTPYMVEPMDTLKSRQHEAVVLVAPARSGKTQGMLDGWLSHIITADPGDVGFYFGTQALAHDYRKRRVERLHRYSPMVKSKLSPRSHDTTIEMVVYRNGMILNLGWPTSSQLAQRDLRYVALSDYDSFPDDIGGEGSAFDLAKKRVQVAMSAGMALVESSPKRVVVGTNTESERHEAPLTAGGILPLYNRGDRRRWYWECIDGCRKLFEAPAMPSYDDHEEIDRAARSAHVACPHCGVIYRQDRKRSLNLFGRWIAARKSNIASFWFLGCAAAFQNWDSIVSNYLSAKRHMAQSSDETALAATINTDQGLPYKPAALARMKNTGYLSARREPAERFHIPRGARILFAAVDVQTNRFEVAVWGYGPERERWLIDRFALRETEEKEPLRPAEYIEHWDVLEQRVVNGTWRLPDGMEGKARRVAVDSGGVGYKGGKIQATRRAYDWWRRLRSRKLAHRVWLIKGEKRKAGSMVRKTYPDSSKRSDRWSGGAGDVPVLLLNVDKLKDAAHLDLQRDVAGPGYIHLPEWIEARHLKELVSEKRDEKGWAQVSKRNETWDLLIYADALWHFEACEGINWNHPPPWAAPWEHNSERITHEQGKIIRATKRIEIGSGRKGLIR